MSKYGILRIVALIIVNFGLGRLYGQTTFISLLLFGIAVNFFIISLTEDEE